MKVIQWRNLIRKWNWILTDRKSGKYLIKMSWYHIHYHAMIKHDYSPYDKTKKEYFVNRTKRLSV